MSYQDFIEYEKIPVLFIDKEETSKTVRNPLYMPILTILREGPKTLKEIKKEYKKHAAVVPPDKTLYRHLKNLKEAGLITDAGRRVYKDQTMTEKLFDRTATFLYTRDFDEQKTDEKVNLHRAELLSLILELTMGTAQPSTKCLADLIRNISVKRKESHDLLFEKHGKQLAEIIGETALGDLQYVVETFCTIQLLLDKTEFEKEFKECLKV